jgi:hypothetical protein
MNKKEIFYNLLKLDTDQCVDWPFTKDSYGYGVWQIGKKMFKAHRLAISKIKNLSLNDMVGLEVHHECKNRACINPKHLSLLSKQEHRDNHTMFDESQIIEIRKDKRTYEMIAIEYNCSATEIGLIKQKCIYKHIDPEGYSYIRQNKFSEYQIKEIRLSTESQSHLAKKFNCDQAMISFIKNKMIYKDIDPEGISYINTPSKKRNFSKDEIKQIRETECSHKDLSIKFNCSITTISKIKKNETYKYFL